MARPPVLQLLTLYSVEVIPSEASLYSGPIETFRRCRRRQPEVGLKTQISLQGSTGSLLDLQA